MTVIEFRPTARLTAKARQEADEQAEYRERMLVNVVAAAFKLCWSSRYGW